MHTRSLFVRVFVLGRSHRAVLLALLLGLTTSIVIPVGVVAGDPTITASLTSTPVEVAQGELVTHKVKVTNSSSRRTMVNVLLTVDDPFGSREHSKNWTEVTVGAGKVTTLTESSRAPRRLEGEYAVGLKVTSENGSIVYYESAKASKFTVNSFIYERRADPAGTEVTDGEGRWLATFTDGARTATLRGPERTFAEATAAAPVVGTTWVRLLPAPFAGRVDAAWLAAALADRSPDILALAMQYLVGASPLYGATGLQIAGDANYGPLQNDGTRQEGSDFNDYLGIHWAYGTTVDRPETEQIGSLDCSGFVRMVWGYRGGLPLTLAPDGTGLPRRSFEQLASAPGVVTIPDAGTRPADLGQLRVGDLVFFDADPGDGPQVDHVGIYLGADTAGHHRFISSRKKANGPTLGDFGGSSLLDGPGLYATAFRAARRP